MASPRFSTAIAFLSESEIIVIALRTIPVATIVAAIVSVESSTTVISLKSTTAIVSVKPSTTVISTALLVTSTISVAKTSLFSDLLWANIDFNSNQARDVQFSIKMRHMSQRSIGVAEHSVDFADILPSLKVDNDRFKRWRRACKGH